MPYCKIFATLCISEIASIMRQLCVRSIMRACVRVCVFVSVQVYVCWRAYVSMCVCVVICVLSNNAWIIDYASVR